MSTERDEAYGYTFEDWLRAAGRSDSASEYDLRAAWRAGELPEEYHMKAIVLQGFRVHHDPYDGGPTWLIRAVSETKAKSIAKRLAADSGWRVGAAHVERVPVDTDVRWDH